MWKAIFVVLGAVVGWIVVWFGSWPGLALFGVSGGHAETFRFGLPLGVLMFSLHGFWLGSLLEKRAGRDEALQKWQAVFAVLGAVVGYVIGGFGFMVVFSAIGIRGGVPEMLAFFVGIPVAGAAFSVSGLRFGSVLDGRSQHNASPQKWKLVLTTLGAAIGPFVGHYCAYSLLYESMGGDRMGRFLAAIHSLLQGAPSGGIVFCLLGLCLGSALDERSRRKNLQIENTDSA